MPGKDDVDHLHTVKIAAVAEHRLDAIIMLLRVHDIRETLVIPAGESACRFLNIFFGVVADTHREQLHDLAREVFIRRTLHVHAGIKRRQHRGILRYRNQQITEVTSRLRAQQLVLLQHLAVILNLFVTGGEMAMPEKRHLFFQRTLGRHHAVGPPVPDALRLELGHALPVQETIGDLLQLAVTRGLGLHAERLAGCLGKVGCGWAGKCERLKTLVERTGVFKGWQRIANRLVIHQRAHRLLRRHRR